MYLGCRFAPWPWLGQVLEETNQYVYLTWIFLNGKKYSRVIFFTDASTLLSPRGSSWIPPFPAFPSIFLSVFFSWLFSFWSHFLLGCPGLNVQASFSSVYFCCLGDSSRTMSVNSFKHWRIPIYMYLQAWSHPYHVLDISIWMSHGYIQFNCPNQTLGSSVTPTSIQNPFLSHFSILINGTNGQHSSLLSSNM